MFGRGLLSSIPLWAVVEVNKVCRQVEAYLEFGTPCGAFIWTEATGMVDIGVPGGGDSDTAEVFCFAINNAGNVVGRARQVDGRQVAFFWSPTDGFTTLWHHSTNSDNGDSAYAINDLDQVTGNLNVNKHGAGRSRIWGRCGLR